MALIFSFFFGLAVKMPLPVNLSPCPPLKIVSFPVLSPLNVYPGPFVEVIEEELCENLYHCYESSGFEYFRIGLVSITFENDKGYQESR
jgi:hypothetical protein